MEGVCVYDGQHPFKQVASQAARAPVYNNSLYFLIFHKCAGSVAPMSGIANFPGLHVDGETYATPEYSNYFENAIPVKIQQTGAGPDDVIRWGAPTGLNMQTFSYGTRNGYLVNAVNPPLGAYNDLRLTQRSAYPQSTTLVPNAQANEYPVDDFVRAGDIFSISTMGAAGKCLFSLIPFTTYSPQGNTCYKVDDINANLISSFYEDPNFQAFTNPCHCNPRQRECINRKEEFEVGQLIAAGEGSEEAGTQVLMENARQNEGRRRELRERRGRKRAGAELGGMSPVVWGFFLFIFLLFVAFIYFVFFGKKNWR